MGLESGPLAGIRILDFTQLQQGPFATVMLADLGADVIKVEPPWGDPGRKLLIHEDGYSSFFEALNRNKRSVALDLKTEAGKAVALRLASKVDVVVENFRPGVMEALGLGYQVLKEASPGIVFATASTFGPRGPRAGDPGFDHTAQAVSGFLMASRRRDEPPELPNGALADAVGGLVLVQSILAALVERERNGALGRRVDVSLYGSMLALQTRRFATETYHRSALIPPSASAGSFSCCLVSADGLWITFGLLDGRSFAGLCKALSLEHLATDPRFVDNRARSDHEEQLIDILRPWVASQPAGYWISRLGTAGIPCSIVQDYEMIAIDPQALANGYTSSYVHPLFGELHVTGRPAIYAGMSDLPPMAAPLRPGYHTREVLLSFGWGSKEIEELANQKAILVSDRSETDVGNAG